MAACMSVCLCIRMFVRGNCHVRTTGKGRMLACGHCCIVYLYDAPGLRRDGADEMLRLCDPNGMYRPYREKLA